MDLKGRPVNLLSPALLYQLSDTIQTYTNHTAIDVFVLCSKKSNSWIAGADIGQMYSLMQETGIVYSVHIL